jgi:surface-anchored protein
VNPRAQADNNLLGIPGKTSTFDVLANDARPLPGHTFTITGVSGASNGTLVIAPDGKTIRYTPSDLTTGIDRFSYTVTVNSSDAFNGYSFTGQSYVKIGGYVVVDSPTSSQHIDLDFDFVAGQEWIQRIRTDATINGSVESGTFGPSIHDSDEGAIFFDPSTKITRNASSTMDPLGVPAGADVWHGPTSGNGNKVFLGIASESTSGIESYTPVGDPRAVSNALWVRTDLVAFSGPGHFAAFNGGSLAIDTFDGVNPSTGSEATSGDNSNVSDTLWGFSGSHAHPAWYFTAPGRYELTFRSTVRVGGVFVTSPNTVFTFDVDTMSGNVRLRENPPTLKNDAISVIEDSAATSINVLANDSSNPDGFETLAITAITQSANGSASITGGGSGVSYTPAADFSGADSFTYTVTDEHGGTATSTVSVTVTPANDMPSFVKGINRTHVSGATGAQSFASWVTSINDGDPGVAQSLNFAVSVVSGGGLFSVLPSINASGTLEYTLDGSSGSASLSVTLTDDTSLGDAALTTVAQVFTISVEASDGIAAWRQTHFGSSHDEGPVAYSANPDGDSLNNLQEWAFGLNPTLNDGSALLVTGATIIQRGTPQPRVVNIPNSVDFRAMFGRRKNHVAAGLTYTVQFSAGLDIWQDSVAVPTVIADDGEIEACTVPYPFFINGKKARFFRVSISVAP